MAWRAGSRWRGVALGAALTAFACAPAHASKITETTRQKTAAEGERESIQKKLGRLKTEIGKTENQRSDAADDLRESEAAISSANKKLYDLNAQQTKIKARINQLSQDAQRLSSVVQAQQIQLERLLRQRYQQGDQRRLKLLLSGDNPNRINREMQYLGYLSQSQAELIDTLRTNLAAVEDNRRQTQASKTELDGVLQEERTQKSALEKEKANRAQLLTQLSNKLTRQRQEADTLERNQKRLSDLVDKLSAQIEAQKKAEAEAARKRAEKLAREKAERAERARREQAQGKKGGRRPEPTPETTQPGIENEALPSPQVQDGVFARLRGQLRLPVKGTVVSRYGSKTPVGPSPNGLFIAAPESTAVHAIAPGRVVFADWMRGFGNLIIVDHGSQYLSIYANNESLIKRAGDVVKAGDTIAIVGNSGGAAQTGLFFELRHRGAPFDPMPWVNLR